MSVINAKTPWTKSLKGQMASSYFLVTLISILISELIIFGTTVFLLTGNNSLSQRIQRTGEAYAQQLPSYFHEDGTFKGGFTLGSLGADVNPNQITFDSGGIIIPYVSESSSLDPQRVSVALIISHDFRILESSYPSRYPVGEMVESVLPDSIPFFANADTGEQVVREVQLGGNSFLQTAVPIQSATNDTPLGYIYIHAPNLTTGFNLLIGIVGPLLLFTILLAIIILPIGVIFGLLATRGHINRLKDLTTATSRFANSDFSQHIPIQRQDELGELEKQFNIMAKRVVESMEREKELISQKGATDERERISMELHDSLSQDIFSLNMLAGGLQQVLPPDHAVQTQLQHLQDTVNHMIREMRALIIAMRPVLLEDHPLSEALHTLVDQYRHLGINISVQIAEDLHLNQQQEDALFRISQEAISNAVRHANANQIDLSLQSAAETVTLTIADDGQGFDVQQASPGYGLKTMNGRIKALSGFVDIESTPNRGTKVTVTMPHERNNE